MNILENLNKAVNYIEENLCAEISIDKAAKIALTTADSFSRFFSFMTGMTLNEYIRKRKLSLAAIELSRGNLKIIDLALKYGWESTDAFTRAFTKQHGSTPMAVRNLKDKAEIKIYPPVSFHIFIKGAKEMKLRIKELEDTFIYGISKQYDGEDYNDREELRSPMWSENLLDVPYKITGGKWNVKGSTINDGLWYGLWQDGRYMIGRQKEDVKDISSLEKRIIKGGKYISVTGEKGARAWDDFPRFRDYIFNNWLPSSEYELNGSDVIEVEYLQTDYDIRQKERLFELLVPIKLKK